MEESLPEKYNIDDFSEWKNINIIKVVATVDRALGRVELEISEIYFNMSFITYITNYLGHYASYTIDSIKLIRNLMGSQQCYLRKVLRRPRSDIWRIKFEWITSQVVRARNITRICIREYNRVSTDNAR